MQILSLFSLGFLQPKIHTQEPAKSKGMYSEISNPDWLEKEMMDSFRAPSLS